MCDETRAKLQFKRISLTVLVQNIFPRFICNIRNITIIKSDILNLLILSLFFIVAAACAEKEDCLIASTCFSWVGMSSDVTKLNKGLLWRRIIEEGVQKTDAMEHGHNCYVFRKEVSVDEVYVDKKTFLVMRWDGFQPGIQRIRPFEITLLPEIPKDFEWRIKPSRDIAPHSEPIGVEWEIQVGK